MFESLDTVVKRLRPLLILSACGLLAWLAVEAVLLRTGYYFRWVQPESTAGAVQRTLRIAGKRHDPARRNILVIGDSRSNEGISMLLANAGSEERLNFVGGAVAGTTPRVWNYLARELDERCDRYEAIAFVASWDAMGDIETGAMANRRLDLSYLSRLTRLSDLQTLPDSFDNPELTHRARRNILLPLMAIRDDVKDFIRSPFERTETVGRWRETMVQRALNYPGNARVLPELDSNALGSPALLEPVAPAQRPALTAYFQRMTPGEAAPVHLQANRDYVVDWMSRIANRCAGSSTRLLLVQHPRGPYHATFGPDFSLSPAVDTLVREHGFTWVETEGFRELESPTYFFDALHLNKSGRERFSHQLAVSIERALTPVTAPAAPAAIPER